MDERHQRVILLAGKAAAGPPPAIRPVPGERALGGGEELDLRCFHGELARVAQLRVLHAPRLQEDFVPGSGQPVGEGCGMLRGTALVGVGGPTIAIFKMCSPVAR